MFQVEERHNSVLGTKHIARVPGAYWEKRKQSEMIFKRNL